jgi:hypothetical protein
VHAEVRPLAGDRVCHFHLPKFDGCVRRGAAGIISSARDDNIFAIAELLAPRRRESKRCTG